MPAEKRSFSAWKALRWVTLASLVIVVVLMLRSVGMSERAAVMMRAVMVVVVLGGVARVAPPEQG